MSIAIFGFKLKRIQESEGNKIMAINTVDQIDNMVPIKHALISVSDKSGLDQFIPELISCCPTLKIFSTGGTFQKIQSILGNSLEKNLLQVSDYTGQPEVQGGLVKTLDYKIYLGLLTETYNDAHQNDLHRTSSVPIDLVIVNLYPFKETISKPDVTAELARGNIDIGGPCMIRAAAKNFLRVTVAVDPSDYPTILNELNNNNGQTSLKMRYKLACKAFDHTYSYDQSIASYFKDTSFDRVQACYN